MLNTQSECSEASHALGQYFLGELVMEKSSMSEDQGGWYLIGLENQGLFLPICNIFCRETLVRVHAIGLAINSGQIVADQPGISQGKGGWQIIYKYRLFIAFVSQNQEACYLLARHRNGSCPPIFGYFLETKLGQVYAM